MNTLERICANKADHVARKRAMVTHAALLKLIELQTPPRGFIKALSRRSPAIIAEIKKASPSRGVIRAAFDAVEIARIYEANGAACLSVLTDTPYFQGQDTDLTSVRAAVSLPLLRKDFMIDAYQIAESRALGADCILLIMAALDDAQAQAFYDEATALGMDVLIEVHDGDELDRALTLSLDPAHAMIGVNNRNLKSLAVDKQTGLELASRIPRDFLCVAESGLETNRDLARFAQAGYAAFLIGESLMREDDIGAALKKIQEPC